MRLFWADGILNIPSSRNGPKEKGGIETKLLSRLNLVRLVRRNGPKEKGGIETEPAQPTGLAQQEE